MFEGVGLGGLAKVGTDKKIRKWAEKFPVFKTINYNGIPEIVYDGQICL